MAKTKTHRIEHISDRHRHIADYERLHIKIQTGIKRAVCIIYVITSAIFKLSQLVYEHETVQRKQLMPLPIHQTSFRNPKLRSAKKNPIHATSFSSETCHRGAGYRKQLLYSVLLCRWRNNRKNPGNNSFLLGFHDLSTKPLQPMSRSYDLYFKKHWTVFCTLFVLHLLASVTELITKSNDQDSQSPVSSNSVTFPGISHRGIDIYGIQTTPYVYSWVNIVALLQSILCMSNSTQVVFILRLSQLR